MRNIFLIFLLAFTAPLFAQTWVPIASEGQYQGTSPVVSLPAGTVFTFGLITKGGVICDAMAATAAPVVVYVSTFPATCLVNGKPPVDANGKPTGGDPDPGQIKTLYVEAGNLAQNGTYTTPPSTLVVPWNVPAAGVVIAPSCPTGQTLTNGKCVPDLTPPVYSNFSCTQSVVITVGSALPITIPFTVPVTVLGSVPSITVTGFSCTLLGQ